MREQNSDEAGEFRLMASPLYVFCCSRRNLTCPMGMHRSEWLEGSLKGDDECMHSP